MRAGKVRNLFERATDQRAERVARLLTSTASRMRSTSDLVTDRIFPVSIFRWRSKLALEPADNFTGLERIGTLALLTS
jgi:hypothetical protein